MSLNNWLIDWLNLPSLLCGNPTQTGIQSWTQHRLISSLMPYCYAVKPLGCKMIVYKWWLFWIVLHSSPPRSRVARVHASLWWRDRCPFPCHREKCHCMEHTRLLQRPAFDRSRALWPSLVMYFTPLMCVIFVECSACVEVNLKPNWLAQMVNLCKTFAE